LKRHGLRAVTVPELLAHDLPGAEQVAKGVGGCPAFGVGSVTPCWVRHVFCASVSLIFTSFAIFNFLLGTS